MTHSPIYTRFIQALADRFHDSFSDGHDDPDSLLYYRPVAGEQGGGTTEATFTVTPDFSELEYLLTLEGEAAPLTAEELQELASHEFIVRVQLLE